MNTNQMQRMAGPAGTASNLRPSYRTVILDIDGRLGNLFTPVKLILGGRERTDLELQHHAMSVISIETSIGQGVDGGDCYVVDALTYGRYKRSGDWHTRVDDTGPDGNSRLSDL